jgi:hypothetical protein
MVDKLVGGIVWVGVTKVSAATSPGCLLEEDDV